MYVIIIVCVCVRVLKSASGGKGRALGGTRGGRAHQRLLHTLGYFGLSSKHLRP